jgi:hypothetical protein
MELKKEDCSNIKIIFISFKKPLIFFSMNFFTPKFMKIRCFVPLLKAPDSQFSMKLVVHGFILIFKVVSMHE